MVSVDGVMKLENETGLVYNQFLSRLPMRLLHAAAPTHPAFSKHDPAPMKGLGANLNATWGPKLSQVVGYRAEKHIPG